MKLGLYGGYSVDDKNAKQSYSKPINDKETMKQMLKKTAGEGQSLTVVTASRITMSVG